MEDRSSTGLFSVVYVLNIGFESRQRDDLGICNYCSWRQLFRYLPLGFVCKLKTCVGFLYCFRERSTRHSVDRYISQLTTIS